MSCEKWDTFKFNEATLNLDKKRVPLSGSQRANRKGKYPYYGAQGVIDYIDDYLYDGTYLLIAEDGENLRSKKQNIATLAKGRFWVNNHAHIINSNQWSDITFLFYLINSMDLSGYITGSAQPKLSQANLNNIVLALPPLPEQRAIAATLSCLDDKIELNNRMNKTLEEMAQAIFKSWFVDFEPFQDGEFVDSELGRIPKGWRVGTLGELVETSKAGNWGKDSKEGNYTEQVLCIRGADIPEIQNGESGKMVCRYILPKNLTKRLFANSIVVEISGGSPTQSTGRIAFITHEFLSRFPIPVICTNFCKALGTSVYFGEYVYFRWQMLYTDGILFNYENGTTGIKNFDISNFLSKHLVVIPPVEVAKAFSSIAADLMQMIVSNGMQNATIRTIRDSLLPKLMSSEIRVPINP